MTYGKATVEMVLRASEVGDRFVTEQVALGISGLVWARCVVYRFTRSWSGFTYDEFGGGEGWVHEQNVRNFVECSKANA